MSFQWYSSDIAKSVPVEVKKINNFEYYYLVKHINL